jgi:hypothetical protein
MATTNIIIPSIYEINGNPGASSTVPKGIGVGVNLIKNVQPYTGSNTDLNGEIIMNDGTTYGTIETVAQLVTLANA